MSNVEVVAIDMLVNNSYLTIINALASNDLSSLHIKDSINAETFKKLNASERSELSSILHGMCEKRANIH